MRTIHFGTRSLPVVVFHRPPDGPVPLQGEGKGDVDGAAENKVVELIEEVAEGVLVGLVEFAMVSGMETKKLFSRNGNT